MPKVGKKHFPYTKAGYTAAKKERAIMKNESKLLESFCDSWIKMAYLTNFFINEDGKWIQKAVKDPGRCTPMGTAECPPGSPQYNLAKRFKKAAKKKKKKGGSGWQGKV